MKIHESGEMYLKTIYLLRKRNPYIRSIDIANELGYAKPSISRAMGILKKAGYIIVEETGNIILTPEGLDKARDLYERHQLVKEYLMQTLDVDASHAEEDACRIEHIISRECIDKIRDFIHKDK